jgi:U3 small nucleolar RNA-associated protein 18
MCRSALLTFSLSLSLSNVPVPKLPIYSASFLGTTGNVVVSGRRPFFYIYDAATGGLDYIPRVHAGRHERSLERFTTSPDGRTVAFMGNDGYIILFDAARKRWITDLKMNGSVRAVSFTPSGDQIVTSGSDGDVYRWDLRNACRCVERFSNEDGTITSYLAASSRHLAVGAESGVVNLYSELNASPKSKRTPVKSILNLHTSADMLRFNSDGQILAMSSRRETNGLKLLHVPTATVFSNWPTSKTPLSYVWSHDFSPESRYFAVGNDKGNCLLYRVTHYDSDS